MHSRSMSRSALAWVVLLFVSLSITATRAAAQVTWDGAGDGSSWSDPDNWDPNGVPDALTDVLLDGGVTVQLDIAAQVRDLDLVDATLDGPGDLTVDGQLDWGAATITGSGVLTANGGVTFVEGPDKVIGRHVDLFCDATWEHSDIYYDIPGGGEMVHHAGFTFAIVEGEERAQERRGADASHGAPAAEQRRAGHLDAPLAGNDPTADVTDVYVFNLFGDLVSQTSVTHGVSTNIQGTYTQSEGTTTMGSGSGFGPSSIYTMGDNTAFVFDGGTHLLEGQIVSTVGAFPIGLILTGGQTNFILDTNQIGVDMTASGAVEVQQNLHLEVIAFENPTTLGGSADVTVTADQVTIPDGSPAHTITLQQLDLVAGHMQWNGRNIALEGGANLIVDDFDASIDNTGLFVSADGNPGDTETVVFQGITNFTTTTPVPPRFFTNVQLDPGAELNLASGSEVQFMGTSTLEGAINLGPFSILNIREGEHFVTATVLVEGQGLFEVGVNATVNAIQELSGIAADLLLKGELVAGERITIKKLTVDGGTISGPGEVDAQFGFNASSAVARATIDQVKLIAQDGSDWRKGHIDLINGANFCISSGSTFYVDHMDTNQQITGGASEQVSVDGDVSIEQSPSVPPSWGADTTVNQGGSFIVQPNANVNIPSSLTIAGGLLVGQNGQARFTFNNSVVTETGVVSGNGTITEALGANVTVDGTISPGSASDEAGTLVWDGNLGIIKKIDSKVVTQGAVTGSSRLNVLGSAQATGDLNIMFIGDEEAPGAPGDSFAVVVEADNGISGDWQNVTSSGSPATQVTTSFNATQGLVEWLTPDMVSSISGFAGALGDTLVGSGLLVEIHLKDEAGVVVLSTFNDPSSARFLLNGPFEGPHTVAVVAPDGYEVIVPESGEYPVTMELGVAKTGADFTLRKVLPDYPPLTSSADSGPGTLRQAILDINAGFPNGARIDASELGDTVFVATPLPKLEEPAIMDGEAVLRTGQHRRVSNGVAGVADGDLSRSASSGLILDGTNCVGCDGLVLGGVGSYIEGVQIQNFDGWGLVLDGADGTYLEDLTVSGNTAGGVLVLSAEGTVLAGSPGVNPTNAITANGGPGVRVLSGEGNAIQGARIFGNAESAIDLGTDGPTPNDPLDQDPGPNDLQNTPVLTSAAADGTTVSGTLSSRPATTYVVEIYGSMACPSSGTGDLEVPLGSAEVTTDANGDVVFTIDTVPYEGALTALATSPDGSTSEVSDCIDSVVTDVPDPAFADGVAHLAYPNPSVGNTNLSFSIPNAASVTAHVHDVSGRRVRSLHEGALAPGAHRLEWDGRNERGRRVAAGVYFYRLSVDGTAFRGRMVRLR